MPNPFAVVAALACGSVACGALSPVERAAGWRMLFDGQTWDGWRSYGKDAPPTQGWVIENGALRVIAGGGGGDIVTDDSFGDFELALEFRVAPLANSGIMYRVAETRDYPWQTGPEYQVLDDERDEADNRLHSVGAVYDLYEPSEDKPVKRAGEWNTARIRVEDGLVKHFLNGAKVAEYDMTSAAWKEKIAGSKFRVYEGFGVQDEGRIALQDHGDDVWYRNIRVRDLDTPPEGARALLNGRDLDGWTVFVPEESPDGPTFMMGDDGTLICSGEPRGYIRTDEAFGDFVLGLRWRYLPRQGGNSGVLLRTVGEDKVWPDCVEAQLMANNAGDFVNLSSASYDVPRAEGRFGRKSHHAERPLGEWNTYEIVADGGRITLWVNGEKVNEATGAPERAGTIALQSEGVEIHFDDVWVAKLE